MDSLLVDGNEALDAGDSISAQARFDEALHRMRPDDAQYVEARFGLIRARISAYASIAVEEFLLLAKDRPDAVGDREFRLIADQMVSAGKHDEAITLISAGVHHFGEGDFVSLAEKQLESGEHRAALELVSAGIATLGQSPALVAQFERIKELAPREYEGSGHLRSIY